MMPRRARMALRGAGISAVLLMLTWYVAHYVGVVKRADVSVLLGFAQLDRPWVDRVTSFIASLCNPHQYLFLAAVPVIVALLRHRPRVAVMLALVLLGANETTQLLKPLLAGPRDPVSWQPLTDATWPSGHATAAMSLALCSVIAAPARWRPIVATAMAAFAVAVCYSFLELGWHYPSDVLGGFEVAMTWTLLGIAGLYIYEAHRPARAGRAADGATEQPGTGPLAAGSPAAAPRTATVSIAEALVPVLGMIAAAALFAGVIVLTRPHEVIAYAHAHKAFILGAVLIGALGMMLASGLSLMLRRG
jgi:membrane-associated phospholipid phosphatase